MTWHSILFLIATVVVVIFAAWKGGSPERIAVVIAVIATVASAFAVSWTYPRFAAVPLPLLIVDIAVFGAFTLLALFADRFWTIVVAGVQGSAVAVHLCRLFQPDILPWGYTLGTAGAGHIISLLMFIGTYRHWQRVKLFGSDRDWTIR